ncbi:hypothetical protein EX30DRAFT_364142 [Ascodesmis nigricans]|uniref:PBP domain-containing protein n=1 Tax=Ascodesmis nigricans TaxID=341454 RepID=A0A4V3SIR1_9PEZI|nr:hypothetical protein EX30DRAFT_364142 [Ascodesmis nigricans]
MVQLQSILILFLTAFSTVVAVDPDAIYDGGLPSNSSPIALRIGNGGAGQSGLVKALSDAFISQSIRNGSTPFRIAWYKSDTTVTINYLAAGTVDVGITYSEVAENLAISRGDAIEPRYYIFRDHFQITGPKSNPAGLEEDMTMVELFAKMYQEAERGTVVKQFGPGGEVEEVGVRWLSRYDKSATNIKESEFWIGIGQVPWATAYSTWYHQYIGFPNAALKSAILLNEYTLTDRGTYLSLPAELQNQTVIYKAGGDEDPEDPLLNPAFLLVGAKAKDEEMARMFAEWCVGQGGQDVVRGFKKSGEVLYSPAP